MAITDHEKDLYIPRRYTSLSLEFVTVVCPPHGAGNNYQVPQYVEDCEANRTTNSTQNEPDPCLSPCNHQDSILALSLDTGEIRWSTNLLAYDVWTIPCQSSPTTPNCPAILGPDYDFGEAPLLLYSHDHGGTWPNTTTTRHPRCLAIAGQKSGVVWALDCDTGSIVWATVFITNLLMMSNIREMIKENR
jgi:outer membrane protein assembly factor BamB